MEASPEPVMEASPDPVGASEDVSAPAPLDSSSAPLSWRREAAGLL